MEIRSYEPVVPPARTGSTDGGKKNLRGAVPDEHVPVSQPSFAISVTVQFALLASVTSARQTLPPTSVKYILSVKPSPSRSTKVISEGIAYAIPGTLRQVEDVVHVGVALQIRAPV